LDDTPARAQITTGKTCERKAWKADWQKGAAYVGDRYFAQDYRLLGQLGEQGCRYVLRLRDEAVIQVEEELPVSPTEAGAGVTRLGWVRLGARPAWQSPRVRVVWIQTAQQETLRLVANVPPEDLSAAEVGLLYRRRWQIECFFRWVKCLLGCRHWLAESQRGVTLQLYLALIASVLLQLATGRRPNRRSLELIQMYQLGWATLEELLAGLAREKAKAERLSKKTK
jgi:IS4 transposase